MDLLTFLNHQSLAKEMSVYVVTTRHTTVVFATKKEADVFIREGYASGRFCNDHHDYDRVNIPSRGVERFFRKVIDGQTYGLLGGQEAFVHKLSSISKKRIADMEEQIRQNLVESAKEKLSPEEREVLGISE